MNTLHVTAKSFLLKPCNFFEYRVGYIAKLAYSLRLTHILAVGVILLYSQLAQLL